MPRKLKPTPPDPKPPQAPAPTPAAKPPARRDTNRDFVEQIVVAFILAFVVRGFEAEAFVIPTGSMAPTLMGAHKDAECPRCGFNFTVNASDEFTSPDNPLSAVHSGLCANCHAPITFEREPTFNGDRILVMKYLFNMPWLRDGNPKRWEVIVFHYPGGPETNYIKRLVGMPGEYLRIYHGDILTRKNENEPYRLERKPLKHQDALQMIVFDDRFRPKLLADKPEWQRWRATDGTRWSQPNPASYLAKAQSEWSELRYHHVLPDPAQWTALLDGNPLPSPPKPRLVSDFYAYNAGSTNKRYPDYRIIPQHWVGDLTLSARIESRADSGIIRLELIKSGVGNRCEINLQTGVATLFHGDQALGEPANTPLKGQGTHHVKLANVDGRLTLWVDGQTPFGEGRVYQEGMEGFTPPTVEDLEPARIAARDATIQVSDLVLTRDIYYTLDPPHAESDYQSLGSSTEDILTDPEKFSLLYQVPWSDYHIQPKHYLMLGDNSPRSADARAWGSEDLAWDPNRTRQNFEVPEEYLIGKAFFVYWPHGKPFWPKIPFLGNPNFLVPFRPYFERMKLIR